MVVLKRVGTVWIVRGVNIADSSQVVPATVPGTDLGCTLGLLQLL